MAVLDQNRSDLQLGGLSMAFSPQDGPERRFRLDALRALAPGLTALVLVTGGSAQSQINDERTMPTTAVIELGHSITLRDCSACHAVGSLGDSPLAEAPRFRDLHEQFDVADLSEALAEGIVVGHGAMPVWVYGPEEVEALVAYLKSLEPASNAGD
jgi:mono/diheme cytochrome c family protein